MSQQLNSKYYEKGDSILVQTLGTVAKNVAANSWILNSATSYKVEQLELINSTNFRYRATLKSPHIFKVGDKITITGSGGLNVVGKIYSVSSSTKVTFGDQGNISSTPVSSLTIKRNLTKADFDNYDVSNLVTDVQNVYKKNDDVLVATSSLPGYNSTIRTENNVTTFGGTFEGDTFTIIQNGDHGFYTGDLVYYTPEIKTTTSVDIDGNETTTVTKLTGIAEEGIYFVRRLDDTTQIKLAKSRSQLYNQIYVTTGQITVQNNTIVLYEEYNKTVENQKLYRKIPKQNNDLGVYETKPGSKNGILSNGVEILNYKSNDFIHYNKIENIIVDKSGENYDVINPPNLVISDVTGVGATGHLHVTGSFARFDILDGGFDYLDVPHVTITGGNGKNAVAEVNTKLIEHKVDFNSGAAFGLVSLGSSSSIGFSTYHKFRDQDKVIYKTNGGAGIVGLTTNATYYVSVENATRVKLYKTYEDSVLGFSTVTFTANGIGRHSLVSETPKRVVTAINVVNSGEGYSNNKTTIVGVSTALNTITITDHGYSSGEKIVYSTDETVIGGLSADTEYYVTVLDKDTIKLSNLGISDDPDKFYRNSDYVNLTTVQSGIHHFNYPAISVTLSGNIGVGGTISADSFRATFTPIVRGEIKSVNLQDKGVGYGSSEVLNFIRTPDISIQTGSGVQLLPVVNNGKIEQVIVQNGGSNISSPPKLTATSENGFGCILTPVISGGKVQSVNIISKGAGYEVGKTSITVEYPGTGAVLDAKIQTWNVNNYYKKFSKISIDDGFIDSSFDSDYGLQYAHIYAPRLLRQKLYTKTSDGVVQYNNPDLLLDNGAEKITSKNHSPIIGWAYDGNPIYGPFGYTKKSGGVVTQLKSGYKVSTQSNRPPLSVFPEGFFVEDYVFIPSSDERVLDENNGRFCITPEFPKGTYAYFSTLSETINDQGPFAGFKEPQFPYLIGNSLHSKPSAFNYEKISNQDDYKVQENGWVRNTKQYNLDKDVSSYQYVERPYKLNNDQISKITATTSGTIDYVGILTGGTNYKVNDSLIFDNTETEGYGADVKVSRIGGKVISQISCATTSTSSLQVTTSGRPGEYIFYSSSPTGYNNADLVIVGGSSTSEVNLSGVYNVGISTVVLGLKEDVGVPSSTGIVTYFPVYSSGLDSIEVNDIFKVGNEKVKILNIDTISSRIRVLRQVEGTTGSAHTATTKLYEQARKFTAKVGVKTSFDFTINKDLYFDPINSLALGTSVGIGTTITFVNPGSGTTQVFIPTQTIFIPNHGLNTGDEIIYNLNSQAEAIGVSTLGISTFALADQTRLYVARKNDNEIGVSTVKVGLGSTGTFVGIGTTNANQGLLFFTGYGQGSNHSFSTNYPNVLTYNSSKNVVTVSTASTHGLLPNDTVYVDVKPSLASTISVSYNDYNRRLIIDKKDILASGISTTTNKITISDHGYKNGQELIYSASPVAGGLTNQKIYYAVVSDKDTIQLAESYLDATSVVPTVVSITEAKDSSFLPVNPPVKVYKNQTITFDLSDSSLSYISSGLSYPAFKLGLFVDKDFYTEYNKPKGVENFEVSSSGIVGSNGKVTLTLSDNTPKLLYYQLIPIDIDNSPTQKTGIISDTEVYGHNQLQIEDSSYSGEYNVIITTPSEFKYFLPKVPENSSYTSTSAVLNYTTSSTSGIGSITQLKTFSSGTGYKKLPFISGVVSGIGSNASFEISSNNIGVVEKTRLRNIGFDYPYDNTLRPTAKLPEILKIDKLGILDSVGVTSFGFGYGSIPPNILLFDGISGELDADVDLRFTFGSNELEIVNNTSGISPVTPTLLPVQNSNGVGISQLDYDANTSKVYVTLNTGFTTTGSFPFEVGDEVLVENVSVGIASTVSGQISLVPSGRGYNSENYNYKLFTVTDVDANVGGIGTLAYSLNGILETGESPGIMNISKSSGRIIPKKHFPTFDVSLSSNNFEDGEDVICIDDETMTGVIERWDSKNGYLKVRSVSDFIEGHTIKGKTSGSKGIISSAIRFESSYDINSSTRFENGWEDVSGFLNDERQVIQDSDYYQKFSYALKSRVDMKEWDELIGSLNHTSGFKRFSNLLVESAVETDSVSVGVAVTDGARESSVDVLVNFVGDIDLDCHNNFDIARENYKDGFSDQIIFENRILTDYEESIGNRVLSIDDISGDFNSNPIINTYAEVATWNFQDVRSNKFFVYIQDVDYVQTAELLVINVITDDIGFGYINQYGNVETNGELVNSFDFGSSGTTGSLRFYPRFYQDNNYNMFSTQYAICATDTTPTNDTNFGGTVELSATSETTPPSTPTTIVSVGSTYNSIKVTLNVSTADGRYQTEDIMVIHDGTDASISQYGMVNTSSFGQESGSSGFGTYRPYIDGSNLKLDYTSNVSVASTVNSIVVAISSESVGAASSYGFKHAIIGSLEPITISASGSPTATSIAEYKNESFNSSYYIIQISDPDNNHHQVSEIMVVDQGPEAPNNTFHNEFGVVRTAQTPNSGLGTFGTSIVGDGVALMFTPNENINVVVRGYYNVIRDNDPSNTSQSILDFTNGYITSNYGVFQASDTAVRRSFEIFHKGDNVFERYINSEDLVAIGASTTSTFDDAFYIPNHFFTNGEKLSYGTPGAGTTENILIASQTVSGIGITDKLPSTVYAIKVDSNHIRLTDTAEKALQLVPEYFDIQGVGAGVSHKFTSNNLNSKCLISIDNYIQSPIVATASTFSIATELLSSSNDIYLSGITSITGGDLLQIDDEIVKVFSVGVGSTNSIHVRRGWVGTLRETHSAGTIVTKVEGNYNIRHNTLNFVEPPYGNNPLSTTSNPPDERDWTGITTSSTFHGRIFLKNGSPGASVDAYSNNYVFDDTSSQFNGTNNVFTLTSGGSNTINYADDNAIVLINDIMQVPGLTNNFTLAENSGITSISYVEDNQTPTYDINSSNLPIGGVIVSVGSSSGFGYQPRVSAGGTATVSGLGTITAVSIGNTGSGYRANSHYDIEVDVSTNVGVGTTVIGIENNNSVFQILEILGAGSTASIGIGTFIYQTPLFELDVVSAGSTAVVIGAGATINQEIPEGTTALIRVYEPQVGIVRVGVASSSVGISTVTHVGIASISGGHLVSNVFITNGGNGGFSATDAPEVIFEDPLSYDNIPLIYQTDGLQVPSSGVGTQAKIDLVVGFGSDVIDFSISNTGFGYREGQTLTIPTEGPTGIPTNITLGGNFERFSIEIEEQFTDKFSSWSIGNLHTLDNIADQFDGITQNFQLKTSGEITSIVASKGSPINVQDTLIVLYNNILQIPGEGYIFNGGSTIIFPEAPEPGDTCDIIFYKGNDSVDVQSVDILETIEEGDTLQIVNDTSLNQQLNLKEDPRLVYSVDSTDRVTTNSYYGPGNVDDIDLKRPVHWCKQRQDIIINGKKVSKDRKSLKANVFPCTKIIQTVGVGSTTIYVENIRPLFNQQNENDTSILFQNDFTIVSQDSKVGASATAIVGTSGTITSISITDGGVGYTTAPSVIIGNPVGLGTTQRQTATASITAGVVTSITLGVSTTGYASTNPPVVLIEPPSTLIERVSTGVTFAGDFGTIVGVTTTNVGVATGLILSLFIPNDSPIKNATLVGTADTVSSIVANDYFVVSNSNIGFGVTSLDSNTQTVGIGTSCIDNVYKAISVSEAQKTLPGYGQTTVLDVTVSVLSYNGYDFTSLGVNTYFGNYSFGKIQCSARENNSFNAYTSNGITGLSTSAYIRRTVPLKIENYSV